MKGRNFALTLLALMGAFALGRAYESRGVKAGSGQPKPLYYQCPMHPSTRSDKPGTAPDCGMQMVPVFAENSIPPDLKPGTVRVSSEKQQLIGVRFGTAEISE